MPGHGAWHINCFYPTNLTTQIKTLARGNYLLFICNNLQRTTVSALMPTESPGDGNAGVSTSSCRAPDKPGTLPLDGSIPRCAPFAEDGYLALLATRMTITWMQA